LINSKLYKVLLTLSNKQLNRLDKYVRSPYFNCNENIIDLYTLVHSSIKKNIEIDQKAAWSSIFPDIKFSEPKLRKLQSDLLNLVEGFLMQEVLQEEVLTQHNFLLKAIKKYKIDVLQNKAVTNSSKEVERRLEQSSDYFFQRFQIQKNQYYLTSQYERKARKKKLTAANELQEMTKKLDIFYLVEKMRHGSDLLHWRSMYKTDFDLAQFEFTAKLIERSDYLEIPAVNVYYNIYKSFVEENNTKYYYDLKSQLDRQMHLFPIDQQQEIHNSMISYSIKKINQGNKDFIPEALNLYVQGVNTGLTLVDGELSPTDFRNIVGVALRFNYIDFAVNFANENISLVNKKFRNNALNFNMARISFYQKEHDKVLAYLNEVDFEDVWYNINSKAMLIATYYETEEFSPLESLLSSFSAFIRREKSLTEERRLPYLNFVKIVKKMVKMFPVSASKVKQLEDEIKGTKALINRKWLDERIELLKK